MHPDQALTHDASPLVAPTPAPPSTLGSSATAASQVTVGEWPTLDDADLARVKTAITQSRSPNTRRAYHSDWQRFTGWCAARGHRALPAHPAVVASYLTDAADTLTPDGAHAYAPTTIARWVSAIAYHHRITDQPSPATTETVSATLSGIKRAYAASGARPPNRAAPLLTADITAIVDAARAGVTGWSSDVLERRDTALLLAGYTGAFRRGDLVDLICGDITVHPADGIHVRVRRSKTDQEGRGSVRALPFTDNHQHCPPCAVLRWMQVVAAHDTGGRPAIIRIIKNADRFDHHICHGPSPRTAARAPLFRAIRKNGNLSDTPLSGASVHATVRRRAAGAGYDPARVAAYGGHSMRAGFVTQAFRNGADAHAIIRQTGHSGPGILEVYARENAPLIGNAVTGLGL
ncbi:integrase [Rhodococcoides yunnanense]|uniref:integrase n=1 Tax=Rhodococcoides yunnanense TaxID=278209 RepID=UPI0022B0BAE3|nr:integrase [Rhodococcus yunnanensis]MCZ4278782.1 integrase [Rhodococcus yunnanensis]